MPGRNSKRRKSPQPSRRTSEHKRSSQVLRYQPRRLRAFRYSSLTARERAAYEQTANLVSDLRRGEGSYTDLLKKHHLGSRTARKYAARNLLGGGRGQPVRASKSDRLVRELLFPRSFGDVPILTRSSRDATKISAFFQDRDKLLRGKMSARDFEAKWRRVTVAGQELFADADAILSMANADVLKVEKLYATTGGAR